MEHSWMLKYFAEFFGTLILVLFGNGSVANSFLKGTTGNAPDGKANGCLLYTSPSPRDQRGSRMPSSA